MKHCGYPFGQQSVFLKAVRFENMSRGSWVISCKIYWDPSKSQITAQRCVLPCIKPDLKLWIARICRKKSPSPLSQSSCQWSAEDIKTSKLTSITWISPEIISNLSKMSSQLLKISSPPSLTKMFKKNASPLWNTSLLFVFMVVSPPPFHLATETCWRWLPAKRSGSTLVVWDGLGYHQIWWKPSRWW